MTRTEVDSGAIDGQARSVCEIAEDIDTARRDWRDALDGVAAAFRLEDATSVLTDVRDVWEDEFRVYHEVLEHWCDAARAAAAGYDTVDAYVAEQQRRVSPGNNRMM